MTPLNEQYAELVALAQLHLLQEYPPGSWLTTDLETFKHFKAYALESQQKRAPSAPIPSQLPIPPTAPRLEQTAAPIKSIAPTPQKAGLTPPLPIPVDMPKDPEPLPPANLMKENATAPEPTKKPPKEASKGFILEPLTEVPSSNDSELKNIFLERFPTVNWLDAPANDLPTTGQSPQSAADVVILLYNETGKALAFMHNLAKAIHLTVGNVEVIPADQIEKENGWEEFLKSKNLRLIITSYGGAQSLPGLMRHAKESPKQGNHYFGKIPACLLSEVNIYLKEPQLKLPLWQSIQSLYHHGK